MATWRSLKSLGVLKQNQIQSLKERGIKSDKTLRNWIQDPDREHIPGVGPKTEDLIRQVLVVEVAEVDETLEAELEKLGISPEEAVELGLAPSPTPEDVGAAEELEGARERITGLESKLAELQEQSEQRIEAQNAISRLEQERNDAQANSQQLETKVTDLMQAESDLQQRVATQESRANGAEQRATAAERGAQNAEQRAQAAEQRVQELTRRSRWGWLTGAAAIVAMLIAAGLLFGWPGWAWTWNPRPPQIIEVIKEVPVVSEVVKEVPIEKVVERVVVITATPRAATATPTAAPSPTPDQRVEQLVKDVQDLVVAFLGLSENISQTMAAGPVVQAVEPITAPVLFDGQSTGKEYSASYDIGVNDGQVGVSFGYALSWDGNRSGGQGCGLVWLRQGWYPAFRITDGRYEVYDLPATDPEGWIRVLAEQRAAEQAANYDCPAKGFAEIPQWDSSRPSPPIAPPTLTPTVTPGPTPTSMTAAVARIRRATGQGKTLRFEKGEAVYGWRIQLDSGAVCDGSECWLPQAPGPGEVFTGVVNPWSGEVPSGTKLWQP